MESGKAKICCGSSKPEPVGNTLSFAGCRDICPEVLQVGVKLWVSSNQRLLLLLLVLLELWVAIPTLLGAGVSTPVRQGRPSRGLGRGQAGRGQLDLWQSTGKVVGSWGQLGSEFHGENTGNDRGLWAKTHGNKKLRDRWDIWVLDAKSLQKKFFGMDMSKLLVLFLNQMPNDLTRFVVEPGWIHTKFTRLGEDGLVEGPGKVAQGTLGVKQTNEGAGALEKVE